jgi:hypothetical protein
MKKHEIVNICNKYYKEMSFKPKEVFDFFFDVPFHDQVNSNNQYEGKRQCKACINNGNLKFILQIRRLY